MLFKINTHTNIQCAAKADIFFGRVNWEEEMSSSSGYVSSLCLEYFHDIQTTCEDHIHKFDG